MPDQITEQRNSRSSFSQWDVWVGVVPLLASLPMLLYEVAAQWSRPYMRFFPLTIIVVVLIVAIEYRRCTETRHPLRWWTAIAIFVSFSTVYMYSVWIHSPWLAHFAFIGVFTAWAMGRLGQKHWAGIIALGMLLGSTLQPPWGWDLGILHWLETLATWSTTKALDALAIPCLQNGSLIETRGLQLVANEVCGGPGSLYAFLSFTIAILIAQHRSLLVSVLSLLLVPVWTLFGTFLRLFAILITEELWGRNMSDGWDYFLLTVVSIGLVLVIIWLTSKLLYELFEPIPVADAEFGPVFSGLNKLMSWPQPDPYDDMLPEDEYEQKNYLALKQQREANRRVWSPFSWWERSWSLWAVRIAAILFVLGSGLPLRALVTGDVGNLNFGIPRIPVEQVERMATEDAFPDALDDGWNRTGVYTQRRSPRSRMGEYSITWRYQAGERQFNASVDFPFLGWHDPVAERALQGWKLEESTEHFDDDWPWCEAELENELGGMAYVFYALFDEHSQPYMNRPTLGARSVQSTTAITYQFQLFSESGDGLTRIQRDKMREKFLQLRDIAKGLNIHGDK